MTDLSYDVVIVGSGAGGGTVAQELGVLARAGKKVLVLEQGPKLEDHEFNGQELDMSSALYEDGGGFLTADGSMTLAFGRQYGGSTVMSTGASLVAPDHVIRAWCVPGLEWNDIDRRSRKFMAQNDVHFLPRVLINQNNKLFVTGCLRAGFKAEQFPLNLRGCKGASLCNLGCPNAAIMGTHRIQLPNAEQDGVEVVTRAEVLRLEERLAVVHVHEKLAGTKGLPSKWAPGEYRISAKVIVSAAGSIGSSALLLRSSVTHYLDRLGRGFTCHPAHTVVAEHEHEITNDVGHPKSYYVDRSQEEGFVLETCMYFPFTTATNLTGFGPAHSQLMRAFPRLQMILALACDRAIPENRVAVDSTGRPVVHYTFTPQVIQSLVHATKASARILFAGGALRVHAPSAEPPLIERSNSYRVDDLISEKHFLPGRISLSATHLMGGCGMGVPGQSVTDSRGRVHDMPWLRVADASLFPDSLEISPHLTVMALADRVAEGIREDFGAITS
ncbi:MAG: GMC family oxidoreductase [Gemmatimonadaceae bacterium]